MFRNGISLACMGLGAPAVDARTRSQSAQARLVETRSEQEAAAAENAARCRRSRSPARDRGRPSAPAQEWHAGDVGQGMAAPVLPENVSTGDGDLDQWVLDMTSVAGQLEVDLASMPRLERYNCIKKAKGLDNLKNIGLWVQKWASNVRDREKRNEDKRKAWEAKKAGAGPDQSSAFTAAPVSGPFPPVGTGAPAAQQPRAPPPEPPVQRLPLSQTLGVACASSRAASPSPAPSQTLPLSRVAHVPAPAPIWVVQAWKAWTNNQTMPCLQKVFAMVQEPVLGEIMDLPTKEQIAIAVTLMMLPQGHTDPTNVGKTLLKVRGQLAMDVKPGSAPTAPPQRCKVVIRYLEWHLCCGCGITLYCMELAKACVRNKLPDVELQPSKVVCYEKDRDVKATLEAVAEKMGLQICPQGDVVAFPEHTEEAKKVYPEASKRNACLASPPCLVSSNCNSYSLQTQTALHTPPTNAVWPCHKGMVNLSEGNPHQCAHFTEHVICRLPPDDETLDGLFSERLLVDRSSTHYEASQRRRTVRTIPTIRDTQAELQFALPVPNKAPIDGWTWRGNHDGSFGALKTTIRSHIVVLVEQAMDPEHVFNEFEKQTLESLRMRNERGEERWVSRHFYSRWLGHDPGSPVAAVMEEMWPCAGQIYASTGMNAATGRGEPCGKSRYCQNCSKVIGMLGQSWDVRTMTDYLAAWLMKVVMTWTDAPGAQEIHWPAFDKSLCHDCSSNCSLHINNLDLPAAGA